MIRSELMLIGGRSGVGKTAVALEMHALLAVADVRHAVIEGDALDLAYPPPWEHHLAERNLAAIWASYRSLGYHRLIYTNTVSVVHADELATALGDEPRVTAVLLTASDDVAGDRLASRERGGALDEHVGRSIRRARELDEAAPPWVHREATDDRTVRDIAERLVALTGWITRHPAPPPPIGPAATCSP